MDVLSGRAASVTCVFTALELRYYMHVNRRRVPKGVNRNVTQH